MNATMLFKYLDSFFQIDKFKDEPSGNGLLIRGREEIIKIGLAVNTSFEVIRKCIDQGVDLLIVHHATWKDKDLENYDKKLRLLKDNNIALYAAHDCLDCINEINTSKILAEELGISIEGKFARWDFLPWGSQRQYPNKAAHVGVLGSKSAGSEEFLRLIENKLGVKPKAFIVNKDIKKIGIIAGGGLQAVWIKEALDLGCDTFLTGEGLFFGSLYGTESKINIILATHYATERPALIRLGEKLKRDLKIQVQFIEELNYG